MSLVFAATTTVVFHDGGRVRLAEDDPWEAEDPFVKARPELFRDRPRQVFGSRGRVVETAAVEPGGKRRRG